MIQWLHRYIFRGTGLVFVIGMITLLFLAINSQVQRSVEKPAATPIGARR
jgi:hypothetical protein